MKILKKANIAPKIGIGTSWKVFGAPATRWNGTFGRYDRWTQILTDTPDAITRLIHYAQGDNVSKAQPKKNNFYRSYGTSKDFTGSMRDIIFQCDEDDPPSRLTKGIQELCSIKCDLDIPYDALEDLEGAGGRKLKKFEYDIEMIPSGASNEFSILYKGERLASQNARIEFQ